MLPALSPSILHHTVAAGPDTSGFNIRQQDLHGANAQYAQPPDHGLWPQLQAAPKTALCTWAAYGAKAIRGWAAGRLSVGGSRSADIQRCLQLSARRRRNKKDLQAILHSGSELVPLSTTTTEHAVAAAGRMRANLLSSVIFTRGKESVP
jgi:hypothetical protein